VRRRRPTSPLRRGLLAALLSAAALGAGGRGAGARVPSQYGARERARALLRPVRSWGCQYQNIDPHAIARSDLDLVVVEPMLDDDAGRAIDGRALAAMKTKPDGARRLVLAYLPLGETDTKRWYWPQRWRRDPPFWVGPHNPNWPGSRHVRYWHPQWQDLVARGPGSLLGRILETGYDGALLDRVDAYADWRAERPQGEADMVAFVARVAEIARAHRPDFLLLPQNAEDLLLSEAYLDLIDAHNKESLLYGLPGPGVRNAPEDVAWSLERLRRAAAAGITMLATEYLDDPGTAACAHDRLERLGFLPFIGRRELDVLPEGPERDDAGGRVCRDP
jgi:cysteinyl-tRNA synthetase